MTQKKYKASIIKICCLKENNHNVVKFDISSKKTCTWLWWENCITYRIKFLEHDCYEKDKLIKLLKEKEWNIIEDSIK